MATKEPPKSGLLAKMARFVANPTTNWSDMDDMGKADTIDPRQADRDAMKALIELKRRNDFVRNREFNMLRKLRLQEMGVEGNKARAADRPSFFQSSLPSKIDDKAVTLRKINEIEAQMSMQWWSTKHGNSSLLTTNFGSSSLPSPLPPKTQAPIPAAISTTAVVTGNSKSPILQPTPARNPAQPTPSIPRPAPVAEPVIGSVQPADANNSISWEATALPAAQGKLQPVAKASSNSPQAAPTSTQSPTLHAPDSSTQDLTSSQEFSLSKMAALQVEEVNHDPDLEEAAIRFANGDDVGAIAALKEAQKAGSSGLLNEEAWLALFDLYRATGNQASFEDLAMSYAGEFHRSAPQWISFQSQARNISSSTRPSELRSEETSTHWKSPAVFGVQTLAALKAALQKATPPWLLDWSRFEKIEAQAATGLQEVFRGWAEDSTVQLRFEGMNVLMDALQKFTPANDSSIEHLWWNLRMEVLRVCHRPDEFEMVALDFCVTYEVSPPSWIPAKCKFKVVSNASPDAPEGYTVLNHSSLNSSVLSELDTSMFNTGLGLKEASIELSGHIQGDPQEAITRLNKAMENSDVVVISCEYLVRIDFSAAGALLNWVIAQQQEGRQVHFVQLHRMISAFFHVIGISEHARTSVRLH